MTVLISSHVGGRHHDYVYSRMLAPQSSMNASRHRRTILHVGDYQEVYVAVRSHLAAGGGAEQDDPLGPGDLNDAPDDLVQRAGIERRTASASPIVAGVFLDHGVFPQRRPTYCTASLTESARVPLPTRR